MQTIMCEHCKETVLVNLYFSGERITTHESGLSFDDKEFYRAMVNGRAICPKCGQTINKIFRKDISPRSIIKLAGGEIDDEQNL